MSNQRVLIVGSGVAGLWCALQVAKFTEVTVVTKSSLNESNSRYAQGGIATVWSEDDNFDSHVKDTMTAGAGMCRREVVEKVVREGPARLQDLIDLGMKFTRRHDNPAEYDLHREGGHSVRRILHAADLTGAELIRTLTEECRKTPQIELLEHHIAIDLVTNAGLARRNGEIPPDDDAIVGAYVLDTRVGTVKEFASQVVVLATGGAGKVYLYTTNPHVATGDGMAMAYRAGAQCANMEFVQFHPTCLHHPKEYSFLISEALRGEGGKLVGPNGKRFMDEYDERGELAPRDIVARAIDSEMKRWGYESVFLDMTHFSNEECSRHFPNINEKLMTLGIDMSTTPIPVVPAAHYFCGGVQTDLFGQTSIKNLYAIGEVACTGLHGANRLASNSLLEGLVFAQRSAAEIERRHSTLPSKVSMPSWDASSAVDSDELVVVTHTWEEVRRFMWNYVGIVRTHRRLKRARRRIQMVLEEINNYYWDFKLTSDLIELRNIATVAEMVITSALRRRESRGLHTNKDFPASDPRFIKDTLIQRRK